MLFRSIGQQVVQPVKNIIPQQIVLQNNEDLLKKIKEFEEVLKQAQFENTSLKDQLKTTLETVNDQKIIINDLREDKKDLKEELNKQKTIVSEQKVEIDHLKQDLHFQIDKVQEVTEKYQVVNDKYTVIKTHFCELVEKHHVFDNTYEAPIELVGDND